MNLKEVMMLKQGDVFLYRGEKATVASTYYLVEFEGTTQAGVEMWSKNYNLYFLPQKINLCSCHPWPQIVDLPNYQRA
jgi:hypothetical protein